MKRLFFVILFAIATAKSNKTGRPGKKATNFQTAGKAKTKVLFSFSSITKYHLPDSLYYKKLVNIAIGGRIDADAANYHWPGNLRQMKNIVKRATLLAQGSFITLLELGTELLETSTVCSASMALRNEETEKEHILEALRQTGNNKSKAAQLLNIDRKTLYNKLKLYNIDL